VLLTWCCHWMLSPLPVTSYASPDNTAQQSTAHNRTIQLRLRSEAKSLLLLSAGLTSSIQAHGYVVGLAIQAHTVVPHLSLQTPAGCCQHPTQQPSDSVTWVAECPGD
jgi:hypothetical protein